MKLNWSNQKLTNVQLAEKLQNLTQEELLEIKEINLEDNDLTSIEGIKFPEGLEHLLLFQNPLISVDKFIFPNSLKILDLGCTRLISIDKVRFPDGLEELYLYANDLTSLDKVDFPDGLKVLSIASNLLTSIINIKFPKGLNELFMGGMLILEKEVCREYMLQMSVCNKDSLFQELSGTVLIPKLQEKIAEYIYAPFNGEYSIDL